jgi:PilZ domain
MSHSQVAIMVNPSGPKGSPQLGLDRDFLADPPEAGGRYAQPRTAPRYPMIAQAQIYEPLSRIRIEGRTTQISVKGCYVDAADSLPRNTVVELRIVRDHREFETWARVAQVDENTGMGLAFLGSSTKDSAQTMADWIRELKP